MCHCSTNVPGMVCSQDVCATTRFWWWAKPRAYTKEGEERRNQTWAHLAQFVFENNNYQLLSCICSGKMRDMSVQVHNIVLQERHLHQLANVWDGSWMDWKCARASRMSLTWRRSSSNTSLTPAKWRWNTSAKWHVSGYKKGSWISRKKNCVQKGRFMVKMAGGMGRTKESPCQTSMTCTSIKEGSSEFWVEMFSCSFHMFEMFRGSFMSANMPFQGTQCLHALTHHCMTFFQG